MSHGSEEKNKSRYKKSLNLIPELLEVCEIMHIMIIQIHHLEYLKKEKQNIFTGNMNTGIIQKLKELQEFPNMKINF